MSTISTASESFEQWANVYLSVFYDRIVDKWGEINADVEMWSSLVKASENDAERKFLHDFEAMRLPIGSLPTIDTPKYAAIIPLLRRIFEAELVKNPECLESLMDVATEELVVVYEPTASPVIERADFGTKVKALLTEGKVWRSSQSLARQLTVSVDDLDKWIKNNIDDFQTKNSETPGVLYYSLKTRLATPEVGTDEFKALVLKIFADDTSKTWRSSDSLSKSCFCTKLAFEDWADECIHLARRPSKHQGKLLYSVLVDEKEEKGKKEEKKEEKGKEGEKVEEKPKTEKKPVPEVPRKERSVKEYEFYAVGSLHMACDQIIRIMEKYGNKIAQRDINILSYFVNGQKSIMSGLALYKKELRVDEDQLPDLKF